MTRSLRALALGLLVAPALALPTGATAAPAASTQPAALPRSTTVQDHRGDGPSRRFDIFWVRGATVGDNFVFTMKVRNLTPANTRWVQDANGVYWSKALFTVYLRVNGQKQIAYTVGNSGPHGGEAGLTPWENDEPVAGGDIDCTPDPMASDKGTFARFNYRQNTVRLLVPRACLPDVRRISVSGISNDGWGDEFGGKSDYVGAERGARALRYSGWFSTR